LPRPNLSKGFPDPRNCSATDPIGELSSKLAEARKANPLVAQTPSGELDGATAQVSHLEQANPAWIRRKQRSPGIKIRFLEHRVRISSPMLQTNSARCS